MLHKLKPLWTLCDGLHMEGFVRKLRANTCSNEKVKVAQSFWLQELNFIEVLWLVALNFHFPQFDTKEYF